ncbi:replication initiator protein RctB domain-containing protein [Vibrio sp. 10N.222.54.A1]|uniref:replication initiator protein RctB domain-containing protein n=1 Tax=unclassified Vibrio TaxID=2614977 RepID=UPI00354F376C
MIEFKTRNPKNGSFINFNQGEVDPSILDSIPINMKGLRETLESILDNQCNIDSENSISVSQIADCLGLSSATMNSRIRTLQNLNILSEVPFCFVRPTGEQIAKRRIKCLVINSLATLAVGTQKSITTHEKMSQLAKKKHRVKKTYEELSLHDRPTIPKNMPSALRHTESFVIEQLATSNNELRQKIAKSFYVTTAEGKTHQLVAQIQSFSRILNSNDLQVLFACYTLIYLYHKKTIPLHLSENSKPVNLSPIHIDDILRVQQKSLGGESRKQVRDSLMAIKDTEYDLFGLVNITIGDESVSKYADRRYRNFTQCRSISDYKAEVKGDEVIFATNAMIYLIELPTHIFESLLYSKTLFVFPPSSLTVSSVLFMIYLRFRSLCRTTLSGSLQNLNAQISPSQRLGDFKRTLLTSMKKLNRLNKKYLYSDYCAENQKITFNLWGYHGVISLKDNSLVVTANQKEVIEACNLDFDQQKSPTRKNDVYYDLLPFLQVEKAIPRNLQKIVKVHKSKYALEYQLPSSDIVITLTAYDSPYEVNIAIDELGSAYNIETVLIEEKVKQDMETISRLTLNDYEVTLEDFSTIKLISNSPRLSGIGFIRAFLRKKTLREELHSILANELDASNEFCNYVRSFQPEQKEVQGVTIEH